MSTDSGRPKADVAQTVLFDPYLTGAPTAPGYPGTGAPTPSTRESRLAEQQLRRRRDPRQRWLVLLTAMGFLSLLASSAIFAWGVQRWRELLSQAPTEPVQKGEGIKEAAHPGDDKPKPGAPPDHAPSAPAPKVPETTQSTQIGAVEVVDIGLSSAELRETLAAQEKLARTKGQVLVLMVTGVDCAPCRGVDKSLADPQMQLALRNVRLVRVDLRVFKEELGALRLQTNVYPVFALLGPDLTVRDAIHGGEWDDDVPANIAPVLRGFVRGEYKKRRHPDWSPTTGGMQL